MNPKITFKAYLAENKTACLALFDKNCPEFFACNERADYESFLNTVSADYYVCLHNNVIVGAFGLIGEEAHTKHLNWILLEPQSQGLGLGTMIMEQTIRLAKSSNVTSIKIAASHKSAPFFAKFGAQELGTIEHGWGLNMHRVNMLLPVNRS